MELIYDKTAIQEYMDEMNSIFNALRCMLEECLDSYNCCKQKYTVLYTEIEQTIRKTAERCASAEKLQESAEMEYQTAVKTIKPAEHNFAQNDIWPQLRRIQLLREEAVEEKNRASEAHSKAQQDMRNLIADWDKYQLSAKMMVEKAENFFHVCEVLIHAANDDLNNFVKAMDKAQAALNETVSMGQTCRGKFSMPKNRNLSDDNINLQSVVTNQKFVSTCLTELESSLPEILNKETVMASAEKRKLRTPKVSTKKGENKGVWKNSVFYLNDEFVPGYRNERKLNIAEIKKELFEIFGLDFNGIPFVHGVADFSSVSIATINIKDIVLSATNIPLQDFEKLGAFERMEIFGQIFTRSRRKINFKIADEIAAKREIPIPHLPKGYTADELGRWREKYHFTWDEQLQKGYSLVPDIIHRNIPHTGLVGTSNKAISYFRDRKADSPEKYSWDENTAPITIQEFRALKRKRKHD